MRGELTINLKNLCHNYHALTSLSSGKCETAAVVKANAYGLGVSEVASALYESGTRTFFVANIDEGIELRGILPESNIFILNGFWEQEATAYFEYNLIPVLNSYFEIVAYQKLAQKKSRVLQALLHFDIGMNRLGIPSVGLGKIYEMDFSGLEILYIMGHLSSSEEVGNPNNEIQRKRFEEIAAHFPKIKKSLSNSGGVFLGEDYHYDLTRPGICLYGGCAHEKMTEYIKPVVSLNIPVLQVHSGLRGQTIGYNETYRIQNDGMLAVLSAGYADGIFRTLGNKGNVYYKGNALPIRGRISMDLIICDLSALSPQDYPKAGDMVELIGEHQTLDHLAADAGTISYEILTNLGWRYERSLVK